MKTTKTSSMSASRNLSRAAIALLSVVASAGAADTFIYTPGPDFHATSLWLFDSTPTLQVLPTSELGLIWQNTAGNQAARFSDMYTRVVNGFNGGAWDGATGISSPLANDNALNGNGVLAIMVYDNSLLGMNPFQGKSGLDNVGGDTAFNQVMSRLTYLGDFDANGVINNLDFLALNGYGPSDLAGDINFDGNVNFLDFLALNSVTMDFGSLGDAQSFAGGSPKGNIVPEPASGMLLISGMAALLGFRRRKQ